MSPVPGDENPGDENPVPGDRDGGPLDVDVETRAARLARRVDALERQLQLRIDQVEDLKRQLAHFCQGRDRDEIERLEHKAAEYDALMKTVAWRTLRRPREWYGTLRHRISDSRS